MLPDGAPRKSRQYSELEIFSEKESISSKLEHQWFLGQKLGFSLL